MAAQSLVAQWNEVMLDAIRSIQPDNEFKPTVITYYMHLTSTAVYDAWAAYDTAAYGHYSEIERPSAEHTEANKAEATPFAMTSGDQFLPPSAPKLGDHSPYVDGNGVLTTRHQAYLDQFNEVLHVNATLTTEQKVIAEFWSDGPGTESPPGHWNTIAQDIALREGHGIDEDAKLFFAVNAAQFDAGIATWETKYHYDLVRPISAIRDLYYDQEIEAWGGPNQGTVTMLGQEWHPYQEADFVTPPFPEFVSGHSTDVDPEIRTSALFLYAALTMAMSILA